MAGGDSISSSRAVLNDGLEALRTLHSGTSAPSSTVAYMLWADTTNTLLKMRDSGDASWLTLGTLAANLGLLRIDGSNAMTGDLDLGGNSLVFGTADADSYLAETADDVVAMKVGTSSTTVMEWDGTLGTPMATIRGGRLGIDADNDTYLDGATGNVLGIVTGGTARVYIGSYGLRAAGTASALMANGSAVSAGDASYLTLVNQNDTTVTGTTCTLAGDTTPTNTAQDGWLIAWLGTQKILIPYWVTT